MSLVVVLAQSIKERRSPKVGAQVALFLQWARAALLKSQGAGALEKLGTG